MYKTLQPKDLNLNYEEQLKTSINDTKWLVMRSILTTLALFTSFMLPMTWKSYMSIKTHNKLMYEGVELQSEIYRKFGKKNNNNSYRDLSNVTWVPKNGGFAFYTKTQVYFLRINGKIKTVLPLVEVKFRINKTQMIIEKICPWLDPNLIVILLKIK